MLPEPTLPDRMRAQATDCDCHACKLLREAADEIESLRAHPYGRALKSDGEEIENA